MSNIYNIQQDLLKLFEEIEDNYGDITPDIEEALIIKQSEFKDKVKSYIEVINSLEYDVYAIKNEKARLNDLQVSKEKTIKRLKDIVIKAVDEFGDTTKAGNKYLDYGIGKVSIRNTPAVEIEDSSINRFVNRLVSGLQWFKFNNQLDAAITSPDNILEYINEKSLAEENNDEEIDKYTIEDIKNIIASIDVDVDVENLISSEKGIQLLKALLNYNNFQIKAKADKKGIKDNAKINSESVPVYAKIVTNKSLILR